MADPPKPTAHTYAAGVKKETATSAALSTTCFVCANEVKPGQPQRVHIGTSGSNYLAHSGCLDRYEREQEERRNAPPPEPEPSFMGKHLNFDNFNDMQRFISDRGPIPAKVRVTIGTTLVVQEGERADQGD